MSITDTRAQFLDALEPGDLTQPVTYRSVTRDAIERFPLWQTLLHAANHTTHHRSEACIALTALGHPPASVDLIDYMRVAEPGPSVASE
jgi:uncharacterized damage-inducible protein DinB